MRGPLTIVCVAVLVACGNGAGGVDASVDGAVNDAAEDTAPDVSDGATCAPTGSDCVDPFACCSKSCHAKSLDDGGQVTTCL